MKGRMMCCVMAVVIVSVVCGDCLSMFGSRERALFLAVADDSRRSARAGREVLRELDSAERPEDPAAAPPKAGRAGTDRSDDGGVGRGLRECGVSGTDTARLGGCRMFNAMAAEGGHARSVPGEM